MKTYDSSDSTYAQAKNVSKTEEKKRLTRN